jgi:quinol monooxygenase YgiN
VYGRQGKIVAKPGQREALLALLLRNARPGAMAGCRIYLVGPVADEPDTIAVTEVWDDQAAHTASLGLPAVQLVIAEARPLIAGMGEAVELETVGGLGLD